MRALGKQPITKENLNSIIEYTCLSDQLDEKSLIGHLNEAKSLKVFAVCIPLAWVSLAKEELKGTAIKIVTVVDFPLGAKSPSEKALEAKAARIFGADEMDMVIDYHALINKNYDKALAGIVAVLDEAKDILVKVIIETGALSKAQTAIACALVAIAKASFIKTSTGFHNGGATIEDIKFMRQLLPDHILIKASGGIKDIETTMAMWQAGADRIGTSRAKEILKT